MLWLFNAQEDAQRELCVGLDAIVNQTDFIELGTLMRMFEVDLLDECIEKLRTET